MGIDRLDDDDDAAVVEHERRHVGADDADGDHADARDVRDARDARADREEVGTEQGVVGETRDRATCYVELRAAVAAQYGDGAAADHSEARKGWDEAAPGFRQKSAEYEERLPSSERAPVDRSADAAGSWYREGNRYLDPPVNAEVVLGCLRIREAGENVIVPSMRQIEAQDSNRELVGFEYRFKGEDRIKEKVGDELRSRPGLTAGQVLSEVPDAVRFTFQYDEQRYAGGVRADTERLKSQGFELIKLKNSWASDQYRGINSQWREPETSVRFEVQFHTQASFEGKQLTHVAYERLRSPATTDAERDELEEFQRQVCASIPVPPGTADIEDYPREQRNG